MNNRGPSLRDTVPGTHQESPRGALISTHPQLPMQVLRLQILSLHVEPLAEEFICLVKMEIVLREE